MLRLFTAILIATLASASFAAVSVIEGFENTSDPGNWGVSNTPTNTVNASVAGSVPVYVATNVTEGAKAGQFTATWTLPGGPAASNPYNSSDPLTFWAVRYNVNSPSSLPGNSIPTANGILEADIHNNSAYPVQISLVMDSLASSQLERGPLVSVPANSSVAYSWNFAITPPVGFDTGDGVFSGTEQRLKSLLVYSTTQPTAASLDLVVDNIRNSNSPDVTPPPAPRPLALLQGAASGQAVAQWSPSAVGDVAAYRIYLTTDATFGSPNVNRLAFPVAPLQQVPASQTSVILTGLPTGQNLYVAVSAVDNSGTGNESPLGQVMAINLTTDSTPPLDRIVLDNDHFSAETAEFINEGYFHNVIYTAQALGSFGRTFDTVTDEALADNLVSLLPSSHGIVVWSNLQDGIGGTGDSLTSVSLAEIASFIQNDGNLILSGSSVAEDIALQPDGATTLENVLRISLVTPNVGASSGSTQNPLLGSLEFSTALNSANNAVAYSTTANDGVLPKGGSVPLATFTGVPALNAVAGTGYSTSLVYLGFAFETVGDAAGPVASTSLRRSLMSNMINYLVGVTASQDWQLFD